jgi:folate-binding protein YgfZ
MHRQAGATMSERDGWSIPTSYGNAQREYAAVREAGAGLIDLSPRGRLLVSGTEAIQFLNGLITNDMKTLAENSWMAAAFPNVQGRLIASVRVARLHDEVTEKKSSPAFLIDTEAATHDRVLKNIERFTLAGDFRVTDITSQSATLSLQGTRASEIAGKVFGPQVSSLGSKQLAQIAGQEGSSVGLIVLRATHTGADGFDIIVDAARAISLWNDLKTAGAQPIGYDALETLRIEAGIPRHGVDMDETNVVTEALFDDTVSYTKGCYLGQEIIARIKYRGHVAKRLSGLVFDQKAELEPGAAVESEAGKEIGRLTSVTYSPRLDRTIALGYLKYDYLSVGTTVKVASENNEFVARVAELPFVGHE